MKKVVKSFLVALLTVSMIDVSFLRMTIAYAADIVQDVPIEIPETFEETDGEEQMAEGVVTTEEETDLEDHSFDSVTETTASTGSVSGSAQGITWTLDENGQLVVEGTGELIWTSGTNEGLPVWYPEAGCEIKSVVLKSSGATKLTGLFARSLYLTEVDLSGFDASKVKDMSRMFYKCEQLISINLEGLNTGSVTNMSSMFESCKNLAGVNLSGLDTSSVTDMSSMFCDCVNLKDLELGGLNTGNVGNMNSMFKGCQSLENINLNGLNLSQVTDITALFEDCRSLSNADLSRMNLGSVKNMGGMFQRCTNLNSVDFSNMNIRNVVSLENLFKGCSSLTSINYKGMITDSLYNISNMFSECSSLVSVDLAGLDTIDVSDVSGLFDGCTKLEEIDLTGLDLHNVKFISRMFKNCASLKRLDLSSMDLNRMGSTQAASEVFSGCTGLVEIKIPLNLPSYYSVILPEHSDSKWRLPDGTGITELPRELKESIVLDRYRIGIGLSGEHFVLKNSNGDINGNNEVLAVKGTGDELTITIEPEEGYILRGVNIKEDCTVTIQPQAAVNQYVISPTDTQKGYQRDEEISVDIVPVEKNRLNIIYASPEIDDVIVVNGTSRIENKPASVQVSNAENTELYVKAIDIGAEGIQKPYVTLRYYDEKGKYVFRQIEYQTSVDSMSESEKILAEKGYYIFHLERIYSDTTVEIEMRPLRQAQFTITGFPGDVRIIQYTLDENGRMQEWECENPVRMIEGSIIYFQVEWSDPGDDAYAWSNVDVLAYPGGLLTDCTITDLYGKEKWVYKLYMDADVEVKVSMEPHRISLAYSEGDILDLNVISEHAGLSADKKEIEVYGGDMPAINFKLADGIVLDGVTSNRGTVNVQETEGSYTLTMDNGEDIRDLSEITINTSDSEGRYLLSDTELQIQMEMESASYTYTGRPVEPRVRKVTVCLPGSDKPIVLKEKADYTVSYVNNIHAGTAGLVITAAKNSKRYRGSVSFEFEIAKAAPPAQQEFQVYLEEDKVPGTMQQIDLSSLFKVDSAYEKDIKPTGFRLVLNDSMCDYGGILKNAPVLEGNILNCNIWSDADKYSDPAIVVIYGSFDDYNDVRLVLKIRLMQKEDVILSGTASVADKIYDGTPVSLDLSGLSVASVAGGAPEDPEALMQELKCSFIYHYTGIGNTTYDSDQAPFEAGAYKVAIGISNENMDYRMESVDIAVFTISKRPIGFMADSVKLYAGDSVPVQYGYHIVDEGLADGDVIYRNPVLSCPLLNVTALGEYPILLDTANVCIYNRNDKDVTDNYSISGKEGILSVAAPEPGSYTVIYDFSGHGDSIIRSGIEAGSLLEKPLAPEAEGYVFLDWYKDKTLNKKWDFETDIIQSNITLYAGWSEEVMEDVGLSLHIQEITDQTYTGKAIKPVIAVYDGDGKILLKNGKDYSVQYKNNTEADTGAKKFGNGEVPAGGIGVKQKDNTIDTSKGFNDKLAYVIITGKGNYTGTVCVNFHIKPADLTASGFTLKCTDQFEAKPNKNGKIVNALKYNKKSLVSGKDYMLTVQKEDGSQVSLTQKGELPMNEGNYHLTISGQGNYTGVVTKELYVAPKAKLMKNAKVVYTKTVSDVNKEQLKNGIEQPDIRVTISGTPVSEENYTVTYSNNHAVGTATMTLTGKNGYAGSKSVTYKIKGIAFKEKEFQTVQLEDMIYNGTARTQNGVQLIPKTGGEALKYGIDYTISYKNNVKKGKASITFKANPESGYSGSFTKKFAIKAAGLSTEAVGKDGIREEDGKLVLTDTIPFHKGGAKPSGKFKLYLRSTGVVLTEGKDFTVKYKDNMAVSQGKAYMLIEGKGNFEQTLTVYFDIGNASLHQLYQNGEVTITSLSVKSSVSHSDDDSGEEREYKPSITVKDGKNKLVKDVDYEIVRYSNNMQSDVEAVWGISPFAEIRGKGVYAGGSGEDEIITIPLSIYQYSISASTVYVVYDEEPYIYTGGQIRPESFTVYYGKAADVAKARRNKETDESVLTAKKDDLKSGETPEPAYGLTKLKPWSPGEGGDYRISGYGTNIKPGMSGSIKLQGVGGFSGNAAVKFTIVKKQIYVRDTWEEK